MATSDIRVTGGNGPFAAEQKIKTNKLKKIFGSGHPDTSRGFGSSCAGHRHCHRVVFGSFLPFLCLFHLLFLPFFVFLLLSSLFPSSFSSSATAFSSVFFILLCFFSCHSSSSSSYFSHSSSSSFSSSHSLFPSSSFICL